MYPGTYLSQDKPPKARGDEDDRLCTRTATFGDKTEQRVRMAEQRLHGRIFEVVRIPVVCEYAGHR
jgi:hypothetical protein